MKLIDEDTFFELIGYDFYDDDIDKIKKHLEYSMMKKSEDKDKESPQVNNCIKCGEKPIKSSCDPVSSVYFCKCECKEVRDLYNFSDYKTLSEWNEENKLQKLKPCPFCGNKIILLDKDSIGNLFYTCISTDGVVFSTCCAGKSGSTKLEAIEAWNRRA